MRGGIAELAAQLAVFHTEARMFNGLFKRVPERLKIQRLDQIVVCAKAQGLHRCFHRRVGCHKHHGQGGVVFQNIFERVYAVHTCHAHVGQHGVKRLFAHKIYGFVAVGGFFHGVSPRTKHGSQHATVGVVIVYNQNTGAHCFLTLCLATRLNQSARLARTTSPCAARGSQMLNVVSPRRAACAGREATLISPSWASIIL